MMYQESPLFNPEDFRVPVFDEEIEKADEAVIVFNALDIEPALFDVDPFVSLATEKIALQEQHRADAVSKMTKELSRLQEEAPNEARFTEFLTNEAVMPQQKLDLYIGLVCIALDEINVNESISAETVFSLRKVAEQSIYRAHDEATGNESVTTTHPFSTLSSELSQGATLPDCIERLGNDVFSDVLVASRVIEEDLTAGKDTSERKSAIHTLEIEGDIL